MTYYTTRRRIQMRRLGLLVVMAVIVVVGSRSLASSSPPAFSLPTPASRHVPHHRHHGALGKAGGALPTRTTVFDDGVPAVAKLDPALLDALRRAATDSGIEFVVNGGWRSVAYEDQLRREAVAKYGSEAEAARWVATGSTSAHVKGDAVDLGPTAATQWLSAHGAQYGLCQIYANEPWHYELRSGGCPPMYADPTQDPRMQK